jgi:hypothetical protein
VHPIERLRHVARSRGEPADSLARDVAASLAGFAGDEASLVTACRRLTDRHSTSAPVWWVCARTLLAADAADEAWRCLDDLVADRTVEELRFALPESARVAVVGWPDRLSDALASRGDLEVRVIDVEGDGSGFAHYLARAEVPVCDVSVTELAGAVASSDLLVIDASMIGDDAVVAPAGSWSAAAVAHAAGVPVWAVGGVGRALPPRLWARAVGTLRSEANSDWAVGVDLVPLDLVDEIAGPTGPQPKAEAMAQMTVPDVADLR